MAMIRAAIVMTSSANPVRCIQIIVAMIEIGIVEPTIREPLMSPKNTNMISMASRIA